MRVIDESLSEEVFPACMYRMVAAMDFESGTETGTPVTFLHFRDQITNSYRQVFGTVAPGTVVRGQLHANSRWSGSQGGRSGRSSLVSRRGAGIAKKQRVLGVGRAKEVEGGAIR